MSNQQNVDHTQYIPEKAPAQHEVQQAAQDPNHPANPNHPKHHHWVSDMGKKFGNAAIFGAGASVGRDLIQGILPH